VVWQLYGEDVDGVMSGLTGGYKNEARTLMNGDLKLFTSGANPPSDASVMAHPPGYPIVIAIIFKLFGESDAALRLFQIVCDSLSAVLVFLTAAELTASRKIATIAGVLAALSPQLAYTSSLLLPDSLSVLPILASVYLIARASKGTAPRYAWPVAGALIGISCWLRPNGLLLALYFAASVTLLMPAGQRWRKAALLVVAALLLIVPITIRNAVVFRSFVPLALGSGVTLVEGIADYDRDGNRGAQKTDVEVLRWEAQQSGRPDYAGSLYTPDGVARERARRERAVAIIGERPVWFAGVMVRRAASMLRLERVPVIDGSPLRAGRGATTGFLRFPGIVLKSVQKLFITAVMLPLAVIGLILFARSGRRKCELAILLTVPVYYLTIQSLLHTEYRYVIAVQYFLLMFVAVGVVRLGVLAWSRVTRSTV
jgi:4-amino-4-deoxy-L-arabinose transferase-like glycosyltransferase